MSSATPTERVDFDEETPKPTSETLDTAATAVSPEDGADPPSTGEQPRWRRLAGIVPIELAVLTVLAAITRFSFLFNPRAVVFDELYFREFALHYKAGTYYFDIHPPLGKLLYAAWGGITGIDATALDKADPAIALRLLPALAGTALIIVVYLFLRQLSGSRRVATLGAGLLLLDNALLVESRFIVMDSMLLLFGISAITVALVARQRTGRSYWWLFAASAVLAGLSVSVKLTGLSALGMIGLLWIADTARNREALREPKAWVPVVGQAALLTVVPFLIYMSTFAIHFALLTKSGPGDAFMPQQFQATLQGNPNYNPNAELSFFDKFADLNRAAHQAELGLAKVTHPSSSSWTTWPISKRSVYFYTAAADNGKARYIYVFGNPVVWWGTILGALVVGVGWIARRQRFRPYRWPLLFLGVGWMANYLPFAFIERPMFLYHYFFALIFSLSFVVVGLSVLTGWIREEPGKPFTFPSRASAIGYWALLGAALLSFLYFAPLTYGMPLTPEGLESRMWLSSWR